MPKKYYIWILLGVFLVLAGIFMFAGDGNAPNVPVQVNTNNQVPVDEVPKEVDLEDSSVDFEEDSEDFDISGEILDDFDADDFDAEAIDDGAF